MGKIKIMASVLIFLFILNMSIPVYAMTTPDNIPEQSSFTASTLDFAPFDIVQDKTNPVLYISDSNNKQIIAYNFETRTKKLLSLEATPKNMLINNNELFVCLSNDSNAAKRGAVAIIDTATFNTDNPSIKDKLYTDTEPSFIAIDKNNYIYVYSGNNDNGMLTSYDRTTKSIVSTVNCHGSSMAINNTLNRLYLNGMNFDWSNTKTFIDSYSIDNGVLRKITKNNNGVDSVPAATEISPDDKFLVSGNGNVYLCSENNMKDLILWKKLQIFLGNFKKSAFDMNNKNLFLADEVKVRAFDYESFGLLKTYKTNYSINKIFYFNNKIIAVTHDNDNKNYIEISDTGELLERPYLIKSNVSHNININVPNEFVFEFNKDIFINNAKSIKLFDYLRGTYEKKGTDYGIDVSTTGNKLIIRTQSKIPNLKNFSLDVEYDAVTDKNGQSLSSDIYTGFSTKAEEDNNNKAVDIIDSTKIISSSDSINNTVVIGKDATVVVDPGVNLKINGDIIIYGRLINLGNLNVTGKVYALKNIGELVDDREQYSGTYFGGENSNVNSEILNKYPSPILYMNPSGDKTIDSSSIQMKYVVIPDTTLIANGEYAMYTELPAGTIIVKNMKYGDNNVAVNTTDELNNVINKEINIHSTLSPLNIKDVYPQDIQNHNVPYNQKFYISFGENITMGDGADKITVFSNFDGLKYRAYASVINDENGNPTILEISPDTPMHYGGMYTLQVPYNVVKSSAGSLMSEDYEAKYSTGSEFTRLYGDNRYETSIEISKEGWNSSSVLVLASGENFPDALSAGPLAKKYDSPVLLSESKQLRGDTEKEIDRLNPKKIFIVGGTASISKGIEDKLRSKGIEVDRIFGQDRY